MSDYFNDLSTLLEKIIRDHEYLDLTEKDFLWDEVHLGLYTLIDKMEKAYQKEEEHQRILMKRDGLIR